MTNQDKRWKNCYTTDNTKYNSLSHYHTKVKTKSVGFHENVPTDMVLITGASRFE